MRGQSWPAAEEVERPRLDASQEFFLWCAGPKPPRQLDGEEISKKYAPTVKLCDKTRIEMKGLERSTAS